MARIDIVLATYNGADFLAAQIDSIVAQSYVDWRLIARDDGSDDDTAAILDRYRRTLAGKMRVLADDDGRLGHAANFARVLAASDALYTAFCDQDDVWLPEKLQRSLDALRELESHHRPATPAMVFSDAVVVDAELVTIDDSYWARAHIDPDDARRLGRMLYGNVATGNTMMINAALRDAALPVPPAAAVIDWWVAALAAAIGASTHLPAPTVRYRQHGANAIGARRFAALSLRSVRDAGGERKAKHAARVRRFEQAEALSERVATRMNPALAPTLRAFLALPSLGFVDRTRQARRHGLLPRGLIRSWVFVRSAPAWIPSKR